MQLAGSRGRPPVNAVQRIAQFVAADAGDPRRVFVEAMGKVDFADRPSRGQFVAFQWHHVRIDQQKMGRRQHAVAAVQPKKVAGLDHQRPDLMIPAAIALQLIAHRVRSPARHQCQLDTVADDGQTRRPMAQRAAGQQSPRSASMPPAAGWRFSS